MLTTPHKVKAKCAFYKATPEVLNITPHFIREFLLTGNIKLFKFWI